MAGAFEEHLREAIALNRVRAPRYAALSGGASRPISRRLLLAERLLLPLAWALDRWARPYHRAGVPVLADVFEPMDRTPAFAPHLPIKADVRRRRPDVQALRRDVVRAWRRDGFAGAARVLERERTSLAAQPAFDGMVRHLVESALRVASLAGPHATLARKAGRPSTLPLSGLLLGMHLAGLGPAARLDDEAAPLQRAGLPILCGDVPPIAPYPRTDVA